MVRLFSLVYQKIIALSIVFIGFLTKACLLLRPCFSSVLNGNGFLLFPAAVGMADEEWTVTEALDHLKQLLANEGMDVEQLFDTMDTDSDGTINGPELARGLKELAGERLHPSQISQIIKAFDANSDHRIDLGELRYALSEEE